MTVTVGNAVRKQLAVFKIAQSCFTFFKRSGVRFKAPYFIVSHAALCTPAGKTVSGASVITATVHKGFMFMRYKYIEILRIVISPIGNS